MFTKATKKILGAIIKHPGSLNEDGADDISFK